MRRKDREILDQNIIDNIISECKYMRIGFYDDNEVYIVPVNFGYDSKKHVFYYHGAKEGRKATLASSHPHVGFELDCSYQLLCHDLACMHTALFKSIIGTGAIEIIQNSQEKEEALQCIMNQTTKKDNWVFNQAMLDSVMVCCIHIKEMTCKVHE